MRTLFVGRHIVRLERIASTNVYAQERIRGERLPEGTVIVARDQTAGKGQKGNRWETAPGMNLTCSLVFYPRFLPVTQQFCLTKCVSLAVRDTLQEFTKEVVRIKWPNDLYAGNRKIGGILIENSLRGSQLQHAVVGIGINVNQTRFPDTLPGAISLQHLTGNVVDLEEILELLCVRLEANYLALKARIDAFDASYLEAQFGWDAWRPYRFDGTVSRAKIRKVDQEGRLVLELPDGTERPFRHREVVYIIDTDS
ncbi:MAG: biotin--[acetyl-CoA-carboxylase] ligase [Bacteroidota bacterium]